MNTAERLAREIQRVAELRAGAIARLPSGVFLLTDVVDAALEEACRAIGSGDDGRMEAAGLQLQAIT